MSITKHQADYRWSGCIEIGALEQRKRRNSWAFNMSKMVLKFIAVKHGKQVSSSQKGRPRKRDGGSTVPTFPIEKLGYERQKQPD